MITTRRKPDFKRNLYEKEAWDRSELVCGIDEVGRSCLSGPVVAAAAILKPYAGHSLLKDSKVLTAEQREKAYQWLLKNSTFAVGITHHRLIDSLNIYQATLVAMNRALMQLLSISPQQPSCIVIDAMPLTLPHLSIPVIHFNFGERQSKSIAAASIIAKVTRDALMSRLDHITPGYDYTHNKGYGTQAHRVGIANDGLTVLHRMSFITNKTHADKPLPIIFEQIDLGEHEI
jgi:ribonuclease HII